MPEHKIESSEDKFQNLISQAPVLIAKFVGPSFITVTINKMALEIWGKSYDEVINKPLFESSPELEDGLKTILNDIYTTGVPFISNEIPVQLKRIGKPDMAYFNSVYQPLLDVDNKIYGIILIGTEITEAVNARKQSEASELLSRTILENSPDCLKILDTDGRIQYVNYNGLFQMEIDDFSTIKNINWDSLWNSESQGLVKSSIDNALKGETSRFTAFCPTAKGTPKWWDVVVAPVCQPGEPIRQILSVSKDITEQKRFSEELREKVSQRTNELHIQNEIFKQAEESSRQGSYSFNLTTGKLAFSDNLFRLIGYEPDKFEPTLDEFYKHVHPDDKEYVKQLVQKFFQRKTADEWHYRMNTKIGKVINIKGTGRVIKSGNENLLVGIMQDVTKEFELIKELQQKEEYSKNIINNAPDAVILINEKSIITLWNPKAEEIFGWTTEEVLGLSLSNIIIPTHYREAHIEGMKRFLKTGETNILNKTIEITALNKEGKVFPISLTISQATQHGNKLFIAFVKDITIEKENKDQLMVKTKQLEEINEALLENIQLVIQQDKTIETIKEFKFLADSIPQIVWTSRPDGYLDYYNQHWIDYTGMSIEETQGWGWESILHPDDLQNCIEVWTESITTGKPYEVEYRFKRASDGIYKWHLGRALPMRNDQGEIVKWFGSCTDIDVYKRALDLENKIEQFEDFNRIVAHNLRGPAGSIDMMIGILAESDSEAERLEMIRLIKSTSSSLNTTLNELMQVLEVRFNKNMTYDTCNLQELVDETENMMRGQMISKQAIIKTAFEVSDIEFPLMYMKSIFYNMISNSLKYSHTDVPALIEISTKKHFGKTVLEFNDNGLGIDLQMHGNNMFKLNKVFHSGFDSKGVGLFMTKTQIETFGGTISAESEPGKGTKFIITL
ncbi:PAS domain S-box protein [Daejeonella sp.]|uniref:PAS domain-containing sensor histidine kinase n=1 Tax=Daejeonella sp. TaxID=2805397 RepID=UPI0030BEFD38